MERTLEHRVFTKGQGSHSILTKLKWQLEGPLYLLAISANWVQDRSLRESSENGRLPISFYFP